MPRREFISVLNLTEKQIKSFWKKIQIGQPDECWPWTAFRNPLGYGTFFSWHEGRQKALTRMSHRIAYALFHKREPELCILHRCDNPACCNPHHLFEGTDKDNSLDCIQKGRLKILNGSENGMAKLNEVQVREIKRRLSEYHPGDIKKIAAEFKVCAGTISAIRHGLTWRNL